MWRVKREKWTWTLRVKGQDIGVNYELFGIEPLHSFGRLVCSCGPSQLPCCRGVGASSTTILQGLQLIRRLWIKHSNRIGFLRSVFSLARVGSLQLVFISPLFASSTRCLAGSSSFFRLLPSRPLSDSSADPPLASSANLKSNSSSDSVLRSLPLLSCSLPWSFGTSLPLPWSFGTSLPLKFGTSRCRNPSAPEKCRNLWRPRYRRSTNPSEHTEVWLHQRGHTRGQSGSAPQCA